MSSKLGDLGPGVGEVQQRLIESGEQVDQAELTQALFGPSTKTAVIDFQTSHLDTNGHHLTADGVVGPLTFAALANPRLPVEQFIMPGWRGEPAKAPNAEALAAVSAAIGEIGNKEDPATPNWGPMVKKYGQKWDPDAKQYQPWCAYGVSWCWAKAPNGSPFGVKASALKIYDWGATNKKIVASNEPVLPGDIGVILRAGGRGHVEIVTGLEFDKMIGLVGFNVGNAVRGTVRERGAFSHFVRPI